MRKILVLRGGALGDFIVTLPALTLLRRRWPAAWMEIAGNATAGQLGVAAAAVDAVHSQHEARWSALFSRAALPADFARWLRSFDLIVNFWPDADGELARRFPCRPDQVFLSAAAHPTMAPAARHYCDLLGALGLVTEEYRPHLDCFSGRRGTTIAIHAGSGSPRKNWPVDRWMELCRLLPPPLLIVGGEADGEALAALAAFGEVARRCPLPELAARLGRCRLFLGHDSGVSHLAAAVGTPCLVLFGPTDPAMWAPPGDHVRVLQRGPTLDSIAVADVLAALADQTKRQGLAAQTGPA